MRLASIPAGGSYTPPGVNPRADGARAGVRVTQRDRTARLPANAIRTILFVAANGAVGRTALGAFQRSLPPASGAIWSWPMAGRR